MIGYEVFDTGALALAGAFMAFFLVIGIGIYVYVALAWMTIAKKLGYGKPWLAWIPLANYFLFPILAKKKWTWGFMFLIPIVNLVFLIIWTWKIYEQRKYPGALSLIQIGMILPFLSWIAGIAHLVILGVVAWSDR